MSIKRVWTLIKAEVFHGPKDIVLVMAIVLPILLAFFVNLAFGNIFSDRAKLGIFDEGNSQVVQLLKVSDTITVKIYANEPDLRAATANGSVDIGIVLPENFDNTIATGNVKLKAYVWGEALAKNRMIIPVAISDAVREIEGSVLPVNIETVALGSVSSLPWNDRLLPLVILMAVFFGGLMIPASSLINEKNRHTLEALNVSPTTIGDIFIAKGIIGMLLAIFMGMLTLVISSGFTSSFYALILVLGMGAIMAAEVGILVGAYIKDINTLFAFWKFGGILLFGPAFIFMFPQIPQWIGYIFPTYYVIRPVVDLTVNGLALSSVALYLIVLAVIIVVLALIINVVIMRLSTRALRLNA